MGTHLVFSLSDSNISRPVRSHLCRFYRLANEINWYNELISFNEIAVVSPLSLTPLRLFVFSGGKFITVGDRIRLPDDVTMGYIIEYLLKKQLTVIEQFHSHLEPMKFLNKDTFGDQVLLQVFRLFRDSHFRYLCNSINLPIHPGTFSFSPATLQLEKGTRYTFYRPIQSRPAVIN